MLLVFAASAGAIAGCLMRFGLQALCAQRWPDLPWGTFAANSLGCFAAGMCLQAASQWDPVLKAAVVTGFLGSLTTLSSLHSEVVHNFGQGRYLLAAGHWVGGSLWGLVCVVVGYRLVQR